MSIKDNFLKEAKIGSYVELMIGPKEIKGTIVSLDMSTVQIEKNDGKKPTISLESISFFEILESNENLNITTIDREEKKSSQSDFLAENGPKELLNQPIQAFEKLLERGEEYFKAVEQPIARSYYDVAKSADNSVKNELLSINNSLNYAIKQMREVSPADYKIQENIKLLNRIIKSDKSKNDKSAANMLGALYYQLKCESLAIETYLKGDDNVSAFAIAESINNTEQMELFACRHLVDDDELNSYILKWLALRIIKNKDYSILSEIAVSNQKTEKIHGYLALIKIVLLANNVNYNSSLDDISSKKTLAELLRLVNREIMGNGTTMIDHLPNRNTRFETDKGPASMWPTYIEAKKAREQEKNFIKAEKLYIEAIKENEKPEAATADLVGLMMQRRLFNRAAEYLKQYGSRYMSEEAYDNVKKQLIKIDTKLANKFYQSEEEETGIDYFLLAQKSELEEKNLQKAITFYKEAIRRKQRLTGSVPNLVSIYMRLEMFDEALRLLDDAGNKYMETIKYLNLRISVFSSAKDSKYKQDIIDTFKKVIALAKSKEKKADLLYSEAYLLNQIGEYVDAVKLFMQVQNQIENGVYLVADKAARQKLNSYLGLCNAYLKLEDYNKSRGYAEAILKIQPENEFAKSVISGQLNEELKYIEDTIGVSKISEYIVQRINKLSLENELKNKTSIQSGIFVGKEDEAARIINGIINTQVRASVNDEIQSNNYFAIAKIIRQVLDRDEEISLTNPFNERNYQLHVAIGSFFYGNFRLYRNELTNNFDSARYCFLQAISIFRDAEITHKCWAAATVRYIQTYFYNTTEIKEKVGKIYYFFKDYEKEYKDEIKRVMQENIKTSTEEFVSGMLEMLTYNSRIRDLVLSNIRKTVMENRILDVLGNIRGERVDFIGDDEQFKEIWELTTRAYHVKREAFLRLISDTIETVFIVGHLSENYIKLNASEFEKYLNQTDREYFNDIKQIFYALQRYSENSEFDYKAITLGRADDIRKRLEEKIADYPTYISFERFLPMLTQLQAKIFRESSQLYGNSEPDISVGLSGDCSVSIEEDKIIAYVPVAFTNKNNVQNADNVSIKIVGTNVDVINDEQLSKGLLVGNGKAQEKMVEFKINQDTLKDQEFSVNVEIQYQYKTSMTEFKDERKEIPLSIPLYRGSTFQTIHNKFEPYRNGSVVKDPEMFYGRDKEIDSIIQQMSDESGDVLRGRSLALYGQTRTGKSSLLYHLKRKLREINKEKFVIIDIGSIGDQGLSGKDITHFLYSILDGLNYEINSEHPALKQLLFSNGISIEANKVLENSEQSQLLYFNDIFKKIKRCIEKNDCEYNVIVMIDEFTYIYDWINMGTMTDRIMKFWKAFIQNNGIFAIIIGQDHMMRFVGDERFTNDFGSTDLRKVTYLPEDDAKRLMYEPIMLDGENGEKINRFKEGALDRLYELTAGSAFLIMNLCAGLVEYLNAKIHSVFITRAHIDGYLKGALKTFEEARFFEPQYDDKGNQLKDSANEENKRILHNIALLSNKKEWTPLSSVVKTDNDKKLIEALEQRDVVIISNGERCKIKVELYKEWILSKFPGGQR